MHERSVDTDFLLLELREMIRANKKLKVILMSATINQETFSDYFGNAPVIEIPGRTFPVENSESTELYPFFSDVSAIVYLEKILSTLDYRPPAIRGGEKLRLEQSKAFRSYFEGKGVTSEIISRLELLRRTNRIDYQVSSVRNSSCCLTTSQARGRDCQAYHRH